MATTLRSWGSLPPPNIVVAPIVKVTAAPPVPRTLPTSSLDG